MRAAITKPYNWRVSWHALFSRTLIVSAFAGASGLAVAGDATPPAPEPGAGALEEIVVTAPRREESISKVPISITAMSQDMLEQKGNRRHHQHGAVSPPRL